MKLKKIKTHSCT